MNKVYACSDLHGMYNLWQQIKDYTDDTDTIYFLGDAIDRGDEGVRILDELFADPRVVMLKGNHEDMMTICLPEIMEGDFTNLYWWGSNGGQPTLDKISYKSEADVYKIITKCKTLPTTVWYHSPRGHRVFLSHAGTDLRYSEKEWYYMGVSDCYIWNRRHFNCPKPPADMEMDDVVQVHGHTPTPILAQKLGLDWEHGRVEVITYCDGHKIDIDLGTFNTYKTALIDLDTFEVKYFEMEK